MDKFERIENQRQTENDKELAKHSEYDKDEEAKNNSHIDEPKPH